MRGFFEFLCGMAVGVAVWEVLGRRDLTKILNRYEASVSRLITMLSEDNAIRLIEHIRRDNERTFLFLGRVDEIQKEVSE